MSQWTHVSGVFRIDGIDVRMVPETAVRNVLGTPSRYSYPAPGEDIDAWLARVDFTDREAVGIPAGSEGSLQYEVIRAGDGAVLWTVPVWGDLRDFGGLEVEAILVPWFTNIVQTPAGAGLMFRDAHLIVDIEGGATWLLRASDGNVQRVNLSA